MSSILHIPRWQHVLYVVLSGTRCFQGLDVPKSASHHIEGYGDDDEYGAKDFSNLIIKPDHHNRPLWIVRLTCYLPSAPFPVSFFINYSLFWTKQGARWTHLSRVLLARIQTRSRLSNHNSRSKCQNASI